MKKGSCLYKISRVHVVVNNQEINFGRDGVYTRLVGACPSQELINKLRRDDVYIRLVGCMC